MDRTTLMLTALLAVAGCEPRWGEPAPPAPGPAQGPGEAPPSGQQPRSRPAEGLSPTTTTAPAAGAAGASAVMATVNGRPIYMEDLVNPLVQAHGLRVAEMLIAHHLVAQEARGQGIAVTDKETAEEKAAALHRIFGDELNDDQRERMLDRLLLQRGLTRDLWQATMRQNALLRKMALPRVKITDAMLKAEFGRQYGEKVQVGHIMLPSVSEAEKVIQMLKEGKDFAELAQRYSTRSATAQAGGLMAPFARDEPKVPRAMRDVAFALKPGEVSGIVQVAESFHVLKLHKRFSTTKAKFAAVKDKVHLQLTERIVQQLRAEILSELRRRARIEYVHPLLRRAGSPPAAR